MSICIQDRLAVLHTCGHPAEHRYLLGRPGDMKKARKHEAERECPACREKLWQAEHGEGSHA